MKKITMCFFGFFYVISSMADTQKSFLSSLTGLLSSKKTSQSSKVTHPLRTSSEHLKFKTKKVITSPTTKPAVALMLTDTSKYPPRTELSKKAMQLHIGMTREEVLKLLGKPTWAQSYKGMPLDWSWRNGQCLPVDVTFNESLRVNGFNQGRVTCLDVNYEDVPGDESLCSSPKVQSLCSLTFQFKSKQMLAQNRNYHSLSTMLPH